VSIIDQNILDMLKDTKVVDENNKPKQVYHGTLKQFNNFERPNEEHTLVDKNLGIHFSEDPEIANHFSTRGNALNKDLYTPRLTEEERKQYNFSEPDNYNQSYPIIPGGRTIPAYLNIKKPLVITGSGFDQYEIAKAVARIVLPHRPDLLSKCIEQTGRRPGTEEYEKYLNNPELFIEHHSIGSGGGLGKQLADAFIELSDYDGIIYQNTSPMETRDSQGNTIKNKTCYIAIKPEQIISAISPTKKESK
jgi:hypothetical protein